MKKTMKPETLKKINKAYDKFYELHYWLHEIENNYHNADQFRWLHNVFINTFQIMINQVRHALQDTFYKEKYAKIEEKHRSKENLFKRTNTQRNAIVHEEDLELNSSAFLCLISNKKGCDKLSLLISNSNSKDSDLLIIQTLKKDCPFYETFMNDEDYYLAVYREWKINPNNCILKENRDRLLIMSNFIHDVFILTGHCSNKENPFRLDCCHPINNIRYKIYDRNELIKKLV
jgi:hypothetical protein